MNNNTLKNKSLIVILSVSKFRLNLYCQLNYYIGPLLFFGSSTLSRKAALAAKVEGAGLHAAAPTSQSFPSPAEARSRFNEADPQKGLGLRFDK